MPSAEMRKLKHIEWIDSECDSEAGMAVAQVPGGLMVALREWSIDRRCWGKAYLLTFVPGGVLEDWLVKEEPPAEERMGILV